MKNRNMFRLTVYTKLAKRTPMSEKPRTTFTYDGVMSEKDALAIIWNMHAEPKDNSDMLARKIRKITYNGKEFNPFVLAGAEMD